MSSLPIPIGDLSRRDLRKWRDSYVKEGFPAPLSPFDALEFARLQIATLLQNAPLGHISPAARSKLSKLVDVITQAVVAEAMRKM